VVEISLLGSEGARAGNRPGYPTPVVREITGLFTPQRERALMRDWLRIPVCERCVEGASQYRLVVVPR